MKTIVKNQSIEAMESLINKFAGRLIAGECKVILYNNQGAYTSEDIESLADVICYSLDEDSQVKLKNKNTLFIHMKNEDIELKARKKMSDGEIFARKYLEECGEDLIIKDSPNQLEMREDNFHDIVKERIYDKCKDITNIRDFLGYDEDSSVYKMNWDAIMVSFVGGHRELWQRC